MEGRTLSTKLRMAESESSEEGSYSLDTPGRRLEQQPFHRLSEQLELSEWTRPPV